jgi:hypothetical protein
VSVRLTGNPVSDNRFGENSRTSLSSFQRPTRCQLVAVALGTGALSSALGAAPPDTAACYWSGALSSALGAAPPDAAACYWSALNIVKCDNCLCENESGWFDFLWLLKYFHNSAGYDKAPVTRQRQPTSRIWKMPIFQAWHQHCPATSRNLQKWCRSARSHLDNCH